MSGLAILIPVALFMGVVGLGFFFWAMRNGQFDDLDGAAQRVLIDDEAEAEAKAKKETGAEQNDDSNAENCDNK